MKLTCEGPLNRLCPTQGGVVQLAAKQLDLSAALSSVTARYGQWSAGMVELLGKDHHTQC